MTADDLACQELVELVTEYLEGAMGAAESARLERHLDGCEGCRIYLDQMRRTIAAAGRLAPEDVPPAGVERLLAAFRSVERSA